MLRLKFNSPENRDLFADRFKLDSKIGERELDIDWNLLQAAKLDPNCVDYDELAVLKGTSDGTQKHEFIVKGDPAKFKDYADVKKDLGGGFYLVESTDGTILGDHVDSIEHTSSEVSYLATDCYVDEMHTELFSGDVTTSAESQWARLRVISKYRPLATVFSTHEIIPLSKPELIIMDSGINFDHAEFQYEGLETEDYYRVASYDTFRDDVGHGTAVAACAVGKNLGVSFHQKLVNVKVGGAGKNATVYEIGQAIDAILDRVTANPTVTRVVNMSWGVARSAWLDSKVQSLLDAGITVVCAAGNQGISVEDISPAGLDSVITVGSVDRYDIPSGFNNISPSDAGVTTGHGLSLDLFAPGENIVIAMPDGSYHIGSGTSFAAPYVSGVAVAIASINKSIVPYDVLKETILSSATPDALLFEDDKFVDAQNKLIYYPLADSNANQKNQNLLSYLGYLNDEQTTIKFSLMSSLPIEDMRGLLNEMPKLEVVFKNKDLEQKYKPYIKFDEQLLGLVEITYPRFEMPEETKLVMVDFTIVAKFNNITISTPDLFFYDTNYNYHSTIQSDVTLALTETNSISFYIGWGTCK